jgi:hypothetical protein
MKTLLLFLACAVAALQRADAHGLMTVPAVRNILDTCRHCLAGGGPSLVHAKDTYVHGMCGNVPTDTFQSWNAAGTPVQIGTSGDSIEIKVALTAHHLGFFEFELCDSPNITEQCFKAHRLTKTGCDPDVDGEIKCRTWWKPALSSEVDSYSLLLGGGYPDGAPVVGSCASMEFTMHYDLPDDVSCTHCVLRWHYHTTNSCAGPGAHSEEFWNCADVSISALAGQTTLNTTPNDYAALNAVLTSTLPKNLFSSMDVSARVVCACAAKMKGGEFCPSAVALTATPPVAATLFHCMLLIVHVPA